MPSRRFIANVLATSALASSVFVSASASAQQARGERDRMTQSMEDYFEGERSAGYVFFGQGLVSVGTSAFLFTRHNEMSRGAAYPVVIFGGLGSLEGAMIGALIVGLLDAYGRWLLPEFSYFVLFAPMAILLLVRPRGIFGREG